MTAIQQQEVASETATMLTSPGKHFSRTLPLLTRPALRSSSTKTPVQLHIFIQKPDHLTPEQMKDYSRNVHGAKFLQYPSVQQNIIKYEQVRGYPLLSLRVGQPT